MTSSQTCRTGDTHRPNEEDRRWWLAINGASCAASSFPLDRNLSVTPTPEQLLGFRTREEQLETQHFLLTAATEDMEQYMRTEIPPKIKIGEVVYMRPEHPEPPTEGPTLWSNGPVGGWGDHEDIPTAVEREQDGTGLGDIAASEQRICDGKSSPGYQPWRTRFDEAKALFPDTKRLPLSDRLRTEAERLTDLELPEDSVCSELERLSEEYLWLLADKPYYNVHPRIVPYLCRCKLDQIPSKYLEVPGGFDTVDIRFSEAHADLTVEGNEYVRNMLLAMPVLPRLGKEDFMSFLAEGGRRNEFDSPTDCLSLHIDIGERGYCGDVTYIRDWVINIRLDEEKSLEEVFAEYENVAPDAIARGTRRREVVENCLRIVATIGFMANTPDDRFVEYDILSKDRTKFADGDAEARTRIIDRARRRGKHGWNVGTNEMFLGEVPAWSNGACGGRRREHSHAHIRAGHFHAVRYGEGRRKVKIKWFRPTVVRPDLGFA